MASLPTPSYGVLVHLTWEVSSFSVLKMPELEYVQVTYLMWIDRGVDVGMVLHHFVSIYGMLEDDLGFVGPLTFD
ncbi:Protein kinase domain-containing protein [Psidium guajava]|nr:Protein kinase domain-containing protein [Psidium guajava]